MSSPLIHNRFMCAGRPCPFHAPSEHHMKDWPLTVRTSGLTERMCPHGVGHPDPDSLAYIRRRLGESRYKEMRLDEHGCCGCCTPPPAREPVPDVFQRAWDE